MNRYKEIAESLLGALATTYEDDFVELYELGEVSLNGKNYEDRQDEWVDEMIIETTNLTWDELDKLLHGEKI